MEEWLSFSAIFFLLGTVSLFIRHLAKYSGTQRHHSPLSLNLPAEDSEVLTNSHLNDSAKPGKDKDASYKSDTNLGIDGWGSGSGTIKSLGSNTIRTPAIDV